MLIFLINTWHIVLPVQGTDRVSRLSAFLCSTKPAAKPASTAKKSTAAPKTTAAAGKAKASKSPSNTATPAARKAEKPAATSGTAAPKTAEPVPVLPPAVTPTTTTAADEPSTKASNPPPKGTVISAESQKMETTDDQKSQSDVPTGDPGTAEGPPLEAKEDQGASHEALLSNAAPAPAEGDVANSATIQDKDIGAVEGDSKQDCKPTATGKTESGLAAGKPVSVATGPDQKALDFPPVTPDILRALEAAVHECRMRSTLRRTEEAKSAPPRREPSPSGDKHRSRAQSDEELPPITHRGGSSGSSTGSRRSARDDSLTPRRGKSREEEVDKHKVRPALAPQFITGLIISSHIL